jgi:hypothetical protein
LKEVEDARYELSPYIALITNKYIYIYICIYRCEGEKKKREREGNE